MSYENIPGVGATYLDGAFRNIVASSQPIILVLGTASGGFAYEPFGVGSVSQAEVEFGSTSELMKGVHEALAQGADNLRVMRIGGRKGSFTITATNTETLTIVPELRDDSVLDRYALVIENDGVANRYLIYDTDQESWVYDSDELLVVDEGRFSVIDTGIGLLELNDINDISGLLVMSDVTAGTFPLGVSAVTKVDGSDGSVLTLVERYAALNSAYHSLDFKDADFVVPMNAYHDAANVVDGDSVSLWAGPPLADTGDSLGYVWQYVYQGKVYTYFAEDNTLFTTLAAAVKSKVTLATSLVLEAVKSGTSANDSFSLEIVGGGTAGAEVATVTETSGKIIVEVEVETTASTTAQAATAINTALAAFTMSNGLPASQVLTATGAGDAIAAAAGPTDSAGGTGIGYATPYELTGDTIPAAVSTAFAAGSDAQLREVNFTHQLASFLHSASTTWKTMIGCTSFSAPAAYDRESIAAWVGELPTYTIKGVQRVIDTSGDDGSGILGNKFLAGAAGYRNGMVEAGDAGDGYAFGGLIKTRGASLPNELSEFAYGILDTDEETDSGGAPVDLGKYVSITCDWVVHRNSYNGGSRYRGPVNASWLGLLATVPVNVQPIGDAGITQKIGSPPRIHATQHDQLVQARVNSLRRDPDFGLTFISARTAAHPDSDYTRVSSIRAVNRVVQGVRSRIKPFIGKDFTANRLISMKDGIDTYLAAERVNKIHQGAKSQLSFTKESRIIGGLVVKLRIVPPFAIEYVDVETSLAAEESDL